MADEALQPAASDEQVTTVRDQLKPDDLQPGMMLTGKVVNITKFGAFVDIGVGQDGLVHISELSDERVRRVEDVVRLGQTVEVTVLEMDATKKRISLSMRAAGVETLSSESDDEPMPTAMQLAFQRAQARKASREGTFGASDQTDRGSREQEQEDILARTLRLHREGRK
mgnify:CR=1 FL=1